MARISGTRSVAFIVGMQALLGAHVGLTVYLSRSVQAADVAEPQVTMRIAPPSAERSVEANVTTADIKRRAVATDDDLVREAARFTEPFEGRRHSVYVDSTGHLTVGVGFNLDRSGAADDLRRVLGDLDIEGLRAGRVRLTDAQIDALLYADIAAALERARRDVPTFDALPRPAQLIVVDMVFNLGSLSKWPNFRAALAAGDYAAAADHMRDSRWSKQTGRRAAAHIAAMARLGQTQDGPRAVAGR